MSAPPDATLDCPDFAIVAMVQGSLGEPGVTLGTKRRCRFCGETDPRAFRNVAHTLPEAFGNKWVTSLDECDACNARFATCHAATGQRDGRHVRLAGLVLVRQKPGSAKGVMFITLEDETAIANLVIWPSLYEKQRRLILTASMMGVEGRIQREGDVVHVVVRKLHDLSGDLASLGERDAMFPLPHGRGDEFHHGSTPDPRGQSRPTVKPRDIYIPDLHIDTLKVKAREFR